MGTLTLDHVIAHVQAASTKPPHAAVSYKHAAVLIPIYESSPGGPVRVLLTQRSHKLRSHPGETCFPGGKRDDGDADDVATALREAREELGIQEDQIRVIAVLPPVLSKHLYSVTPVVAHLVKPLHELELEPNSEEVECVFSAPLEMFLHHVWPDAQYSFKDGEWDDIQYRMHIWEYCHADATHIIWGLTAALCIMVAEIGYQRPPSFCCLPHQSYSLLSEIEFTDGTVRRKR